MRFNILNWNIGGAKFFEEKSKDKRDEVRQNINRGLRKLITDPNMAPQPDMVTLQEIVQYKEPDKNKGENTPNLQDVEDIIDPPDGYRYYPFPLIDSHILSSQAKWNKVKQDSDWHPKTYFAQGNAIMIRDDAPDFPVWDLSDLCQERSGSRGKHFVEKVHLDSGLYFGDRNTEPRAALVTHFICDPEIELETDVAKRKPLDIFVVNVHLTTLNGRA